MFGTANHLKIVFAVLAGAAIAQFSGCAGGGISVSGATTNVAVLCSTCGIRN